MKKQQQKIDFSKIIVLIYLAVISILFVSNYNRIFDEKFDMNGDNIYYYSLGKALSDGKGFTNVIGYDQTPHGHFPPGYPAFVSVLMKMGINSIHALKVANGFLLCFSLILLFFIFAHLSKNNLIAFAATAFAASHAQLLRFATIMMSEMLYIFVAAVIIFIVLKWNVKTAFAEKKKLWRDIAVILLLSTSLSYIYFVRTMGVSLILAVAFYYGIILISYLAKTIKSRKNIEVFATNKNITIRYAILCCIVLLSFFSAKWSWDARNIECFGKTGTSYVNDFMKKEGGGKMETLADWQERLKNNATSYIAKYIPASVFYVHNYAPTDKKASDGEWFKGFVFIMLMLFALYKSGTKGLLLLFYIGITFGVLLFYTEVYTGHRYMTPIMPFLIFLFIYGCYEAAKLLIDKILKIKESRIYINILSAAICGGFFFIAQPTYAKSIKEIELQAKFKTYNQYNAHPAFLEFLQAADWCKQNLPDTARVASRKPEIFYISTNGKTCGGFPQYASPEEVLASFEKNKINYVVIDWWFRHAYATVVPCIQKYSDRFRIINQIGGTNGQPATYIVQFF
jgi:hypothetical protein